jgi:hypothetical protein
MNFKLKALVAAAVMAASAPALAVMAGATSGNGELLLNLRYYTGSGISGGDDMSAVFDLGVTMDDFLANPTSMTWDLRSANYGNAFQTILDYAGANAANIEFSVIALDNTNGTDFVGGHRYLTTAVVSTFPSLSNANLGGFEGMDGYVEKNNLRGTHVTEANGASVAIQADSSSANPVYFGSVGGQAGDTWRQKTTADTTAKLGVAQNIWYLTTSQVDPLDPTLVDGNAQAVKTAQGFDLDGDGKLSKTGLKGNEFSQFVVGADGMVSFTAVTAVPEASTYGMMLAGLGLVGFMARRRMNRAA